MTDRALYMYIKKNKCTILDSIGDFQADEASTDTMTDNQQSDNDCNEEQDGIKED